MANSVVGEYVVKLTPEVDKQKLKHSENQVEQSVRRVNSRTKAMIGGIYGVGRGAKNVLGATIGGGLGAGLSALGASLPYIGALAVGAGFATISLQSLNKQINEIGDATLGWGDAIGTLTGQLADSGVNLSSGQVALDASTFEAVGVDQNTFIKALTMFEKNRQSNEFLKNYKEGDTRTAFFDFFNTIKDLDTKSRNEALQEALGNRGAIAFQDASQRDLKDVRNQIIKKAGFKTEEGLIDSATKAVDNAGRLEDIQGINRSSLRLEENIKRGNKVDDNYTNEQYKQEKARSNRETKNLDLATPTMKASTSIEELENKVKVASVDVAKTVETSVDKIIEYMKGNESKKNDGLIKKIYNNMLADLTSIMTGSKQKDVLLNSDANKTSKKKGFFNQ